MTSTIRRITLATVAALCLLPVLSAAQTPNPAADSAFRRSDWPASVAAYEKITAADSTNGPAWFRLGVSYQGVGQYSKALAAFTRSRAIGFQPVGSRYRLARVYARLNDSKHAFELMDSAVAMAPGNFTPQQIDAEADFASIRQDARYRKLAESLAAARYPCRTSTQATQFDFWIGQWDVTPWTGPSVPGQPAGFNDVHPILEHCVVLENWKGGGGGEGKSFNYFDSNLNKWRQIWMDDSGSALDYVGEFRDGAMRFTGWTLDAKGNRVEQKLTFTPIDKDTVRQTFESSSDGGKTWTSSFDGRYVRRK